MSVSWGVIIITGLRYIGSINIFIILCHYCGASLLLHYGELKCHYYMGRHYY
jgi:hypothetical protein